MIGTVYAHICKIHGKPYVGQTWDVETRWAPSAYVSCRLFNRAIKKYGWDAFDHVIIVQQEMTQDELNGYERLWIAALNSNNPRFGYNMTSGGEGVRGLIFSEETKEKMRQAGLERGFSDKCRQAQKEYLKSRVFSEETKAKIGAAHRGKKKDYETWNKGIPWDFATRQKMSESRKGKKRGPQSEATKQKIREKLLGHPSWVVPHTEEAKARMSELAKKRTPRPQSPESREKISRTLSGRKRPPEVVAKIAATRKKNREACLSSSPMEIRTPFSKLPTSIAPENLSLLLPT